MAAPSVAATGSTQSNATANTLSFNPSTSTNNDIHVEFAWAHATGTWTEASSGFTIIAQGQQGGLAWMVALRKFVTAGSIACAPTISAGSTTGIYARCMSYRAGPAGAVTFYEGVATNAGNGTTVTAPNCDITATATDRTVFNVYLLGDNPAGVSPPAGWTEDLEATSATGDDGGVTVDTQTGVSAGTVTGGSRAYGAPAFDWAAISFAISSSTISSGSAGSASGTGAATGIGASLAASAGAAAGVGASPGVGASLAASGGASAGAGAATGVGAALFAAVGVAAGTGAVTGIGASLAGAAGAGSGSAVVLGAGAALAAADGAAAGIGNAIGVGSEIDTTEPEADMAWLFAMMRRRLGLAQNYRA